MAEFFVRKYAAANGAPERPLSAEAKRRLASHRWPGNVRELENAIESMVALSHGPELDLSLLPEGRHAAKDAYEGQTPVPDVLAADFVGVRDLKLRMDAYERGLIVSALEEWRGNRSHTARALGINRATLHGKLRKHGLASSDSDADA